MKKIIDVCDEYKGFYRDTLTITQSDIVNDNYDLNGTSSIRNYKNVIIDSMLKKLLETLKCVKTDYLKIEVKKDYNTIGLIINNINVFEMDFK